MQRRPRRHKQLGLTLIEVAIGVLLIGAIGGALMMSLQNIQSGRQAADARQATAFLYRFLASEVTQGNPRYTPPTEGNTLVLSQNDIAAIFADNGKTFANTALLKAQVTNLGEVSKTFAGGEVTSVQYRIRTCWEPVTQTTAGEETNCVEKTVTGPVPSRFATTSQPPITDSVPLGQGKLVLNIHAPAGVSGRVAVSGPGLNRTYTESVVLEGLPPGDYTITPYPVSTDRYTYAPSMTTDTTHIGAGEGTIVNVSYTADTGALSVVVSGYEDYPGVRPVVTVTGPGFSRTINASEVLPYLAPGSYTITAEPIDVNGYQLEATIDPEEVTVSPGLTSSSTVNYSPASGALRVSVEVPAGLTDVSVEIQGPEGYTRLVGPGVTLLENLPPGTYVALPQDGVKDGITYRGAANPADLRLEAGTVREIAVRYAPIDAALTLEVRAGSTPANIDPVVRVRTPAGEVLEFTGLGRHDILTTAPGSYTITAPPASDGTFTWTATPAEQTVRLSAGQHLTKTITYAVTTGVLTVKVLDLPAGAGTPVNLITPSNRTVTLGAGTHTFSPAEAGTYKLLAQQVQSGYYDYAPTPPQQTFELQPAQALTRTVSYAPVTGALRARSRGLPSGLAASFVLRGNALEETLEDGELYPHLEPGGYTVTAAAVNDGYATYRASPERRSVSVTAGELAEVTFDYALVPGSLLFRIDAPSGSRPRVTATAGASYSATRPGETRYDNVEPALYRVQAEPLEYNNIHYAPEAPAEVAVYSGREGVVEVRYRATNAALAVELEGADMSGARPSVRITGPDGFDRTITADAQLLDLEPGRYTLTPAPFTVDGERYEAPRQVVDLEYGEYARVTVRYQRTTASLRVTIQGLPPQAAAKVHLRGDGYDRLITATTVVHGLEPGRYTLTAETVYANGYRYEPANTPITVSLAAGDDKATTVKYEATSGTIRLRVTAPAARYTVTIAGPQTFRYSGSGNASKVFAPADPGRYTVEATPIDYGGYRYDPEITPERFDLQVVRTQTVDVRYAVATARLVVEVRGLPSGLEGDVLVTGPDGYRKVVKASTTLTDLTPGTYSLTPRTVADGAASYSGEAVPASVTLRAGEEKRSVVTYALIKGALKLQIYGVPAGGTARVRVTGPDLNTVVSTSRTWTDLTPGTYTIRAENIQVNDLWYNANPAEQTVTVRSGQTAEAAVTYATTKAKLIINVSGRSDAPYRVTGPNGYDRTFRGSQTLIVDPGTYTIRADDYRAPDRHIYKMRPNPTSVSLNAGDTKEVNLTFYRYTAALTVTATGLPDGARGRYLFYADGGNTRIGYFSPTFTHILEPGDYLILPREIIVDGHSYRAPRISVSVRSGEDKTVTIRYAEFTGTLNVTVEGVPAGMTPTITLEGIDTYETVRGTSASWVLLPRTYTVGVNDLRVGDYLYAAEPVTVTVRSGVVTNVTLRYSKQGGYLEVSTSGLPSGASPTITVQGNGITRTATGTSARWYLPAGSYTVSGSDVTVNNVTYEVAPASATVTAGGTTRVTLNYQPGDTVLTVLVEGAVGFTPKIKVYGAGYSRTLTGTRLTFVLPAGGTYTVYPYPANNYVAPTQRVTLQTGERKTVTVTYEQQPGRIAVYVRPYTISNYHTVYIQVYDAQRNLVTTYRAFRNYPVYISVPPGTYYVTSDSRFEHYDPETGQTYIYTANEVQVNVPSGGVTSATITFTAETSATTTTVRVWNTGSRSGYPYIKLEGYGQTYVIPAGSAPKVLYGVRTGTYELRFTTPYYLTSDKRFVANKSPGPVTISVSNNFIKVYWQYQEKVCTRYLGSRCLSYTWVDK